ncbi:hypothetical protein GCM10027059_41720 [Myceligenerans halotolerans]
MRGVGATSPLVGVSKWMIAPNSFDEPRRATTENACSISEYLFETGSLPWGPATDPLLSITAMSSVGTVAGRPGRPRAYVGLAGPAGLLGAGAPSRRLGSRLLGSSVGRVLMRPYLAETVSR